MSDIKILNKTLRKYERNYAGTKGKSQEALMLKDVYKDKKFSFPEWSLDASDLKINRMCFYNREDDLEHVKQVLYQRQPVNIEMMLESYYDANKFATVISNANLEPYTSSGYMQLFDQDETKLPPNIAIYSHVPAYPYNPKKSQMTRADVKDLPHLMIHVLSVVGFGFDDETQPDYRYFATMSQKELFAELNTYLKHVFQKIEHCIKMKGFKYVHIPGFGMGAFSQLFHQIGDMKEYEVLWMTNFEKLKEKLPDVLVHGMHDYIYPKFSGARFQLDLYQAWNAIENKQKINPWLAHIIKRDISIDECLFVNPWDPHSMAGNGNFGDDSLDGFFGRSTAIGVMSLNEKLLSTLNYESTPFDFVAL